MEKEREEKTEIEKFFREQAIKSAEDYFEEVKETLRRKLEDVERYERNWCKVLEGKPYPDGEERPKELLVDILSWTVSSVSQVDPHHGKAVKAAASLTKAFDIQKW